MGLWWPNWESADQKATIIMVHGLDLIRAVLVAKYYLPTDTINFLGKMDITKVVCSWLKNLKVFLSLQEFFKNLINTILNQISNFSVCTRNNFEPIQIFFKKCLTKFDKL